MTQTTEEAEWKLGHHTVPVTHLGKLFWPEDGVTKGQMLKYYRDVAKVMLPHFRDRPLTLRIFPEGIHGFSFYRRDAPQGVPAWFRTIDYQPKTTDETIQLLIVEDVAGLIWIFEPDVQPYNSWGNGSAMRVSPVGFAFDDEETVLREARRSAEVSHNHPEGIKGAQATALAVFLARRGESKETIRQEISQRFGYDLNRTLEQIRPSYQFDESCQGTVPEAIIAFLESKDYVDAVRKAVSLGGDSDTLACITGGIAYAYYKELPAEIVERVRAILTPELLEVVDRFYERFGW